MGSEFDRIALLHAIFGPPRSPFSLGIGDDAAVVNVGALGPAAAHLVWTVDACVEGIHFRRALIDWQDLGWRAMMAAASDLAAMGAEPLGALSALCLTHDLSDLDVQAIGRGQALAAMALSTSVVGGNLSRAGEVSITTTLLGSCPRPVTRSGARPGDRLIAVGELGLAAAGLRLLELGAGLHPLAQPAITAWRRPVARIADGQRLATVASSMVDVSDGLAQDAGHIARASGVRLDLERAALVSPALQELSRHFQIDPLELALGGGEDYALLATVPQAHLAPADRVIGHCTEGEGVWLDPDTRVDHLGHDHFKNASGNRRPLSV